MIEHIEPFLIKAGLRIILVKPNSKEPINWTTYSPDAPEVLEHLEKGGNIAAHLGESNFAVIDVDDSSLEPLFEKEFMPNTFKVKTPNGFHYYYKINEPIENIKKPCCEIRSGNNLCMLPGSKINDVEYKVVLYVPLQTLSPEKASKMNEWITQQANAPEKKEASKSQENKNLATDMQIVKLFVPYWEEGDRQTLTMALSGYLMRQNYKEEHTLKIVELICKNAKDSEISQRLAAIKATYAKTASHLTGLPTIKNICGEELANHLAKITGLEEKPDIWKWGKNDKTGEYFISGLDIIKAKDWILRNNHFITTGEKIYSVLHYSGGYYRAGGEKVIQEAMQKATGGNHLSIQALREIIAHIQRETFTPQEKLLETPKSLICLKNGVFNTKTKQLHPHTADLIFTQQIPVNYIPDADCLNFKKFLLEVANPDDIPTIQEMIGHLLIRNYAYKKAFIVCGIQNSGKTTFLKTIVSFIGQENTSSLSLHSIVKDKFAAIYLNHKLLNFYDDLSSEDINDAGALKIVTGNGYVSGEHKFGERVHFENYAKLVFACNEIFGLKNKDLDDDAYYGRWILLFFNNQFDGNKQNKQLFEKLITSEELSGILNWALIGLDRLEMQGSFSYNKKPEEVKNLMQRGSNNIAAFAQDCLTEDSNGWITKENLYIAYSLFCSYEKEARMSKEKFGRDLPKFATFITEQRKDTQKKKSEHIWGNCSINTGNTTFLNILLNNINSFDDSFNPHARDNKNSGILGISKVSDNILLPCSICSAPPPCNFVNEKGRPVCDFCSTQPKMEDLQ